MILKGQSTNAERTIFYCCLLFFLVIPGTSHGHAFPDRSDPKVGSTVPKPSFVRIWFDSDLEPAFSRIYVKDGNGKNIDKGNGKVSSADPTLLEVSMPPLPPGTYHVLWDVVARDGHRTTGDYTFTVK